MRVWLGVNTAWLNLQVAEMQMSDAPCWAQVLPSLGLAAPSGAERSASAWRLAKTQMEASLLQFEVLAGAPCV